MFNRNVELELVIPSGDGDKKVVLSSFPSDQAICEKYRKQYVLMRDLGNGEGENKMVGEEDASLGMIRSVAIQGAESLDGAEADTIARQIMLAEVVDVVRENGHCEITLVTLDLDEGGTTETKHSVKIPSHKDLKFWAESSARMRSVRNNASQMRTYMDNTTEIYNRYFDSASGYAAASESSADVLKAIPVHHKHRVMEAVNAEIRQIRAAVIKDKGVVPTTPGQISQT